MVGEMLTSGRADGRGGLNAKTVRNHVAVLHAALDDAVQWDAYTATWWTSSTSRGGSAPNRVRGPRRRCAPSSQPQQGAATARRGDWCCQPAYDAVNSARSARDTSTSNATRYA